MFAVRAGRLGAIVPDTKDEGPKAEGITRKDGRLVVQGDPDKENDISVRRTGADTFEINRNGKKTTVSAKDVEGMIIEGGGKNDRIDVGAGVKAPTIRGGGGDDTIDSQASGARIEGGDGKDVIRNRASDVRIDGGAGDDTIYNVGDERVRIDGGAGKNKIVNTGNIDVVSDRDGEKRPNDTVVGPGKHKFVVAKDDVDQKVPDGVGRLLGSLSSLG